LPAWVNVKQVQNNDLRIFLELSVDKGEASAIILAIENKDCLVIIDDLKARKLASSLNIKMTGTLGVIVKAKQLKCISEVKPIIEKLRNADFRINEKIISEILTKVGE
jgi:predicted nucleic acid-binding protein